MSGKFCKKPPKLPPPDLVEPLGSGSISSTNIPVTPISGIYKDGGDPVRPTCAEAFDVAWAGWYDHEMEASPPYETAAIVCQTFSVGGPVLCAIASVAPTYTFDLGAHINPWETWALEKLEVFFEWDYAHDNSPWKLFLEFNGKEYEIESGIASIDIDAPDSIGDPLEFTIKPNFVQPPLPCPPPVTRYDIIHQVTIIKAHWLDQQNRFTAWHDDPPATPFNITMGDDGTGPPTISPPLNVTEGP